MGAGQPRAHRRRQPSPSQREAARAFAWLSRSGAVWPIARGLRPDRGLVVDLAPGEDAHASERALVPAVLASVQADDLWIGDRNISTRGIIAAIVARGAGFLFREHTSSPSPTEVGNRRRVGRCETGLVYEQSVTIENEAGETIALRRIEVDLDEPTEDGATTIRMLTNLPADRFDARAVARLYRRRGPSRACSNV